LKNVFFADILDGYSDSNNQIKSENQLQEQHQSRDLFKHLTTSISGKRSDMLLNPPSSRTSEPINDWKPVQPIRIQERGSVYPIRNEEHDNELLTFPEDSEKAFSRHETDSKMLVLNKQNGILLKDEGRDESFLSEDTSAPLIRNMKTTAAKTRLQGRIVQRGSNRVAGRICLLLHN
jgi:hypothetical protein